MLVNKTVSKPTYSVVNGEIVMTGSETKTEVVWYDMDSFSDADISALIAAGHTDYFTEQEAAVLTEKGLLHTGPVSPNLTVTPTVIVADQGTYTSTENEKIVD